MADYPSYPQLVGSTKEAGYGTTVDRAESGRPRFRTFHSQAWAVFKILHEVNSKAEMQALLDHYTANKLLSFSFTYAADGQTYTVRYGSLPKTKAVEGDFRWTIESTLVVI